MKQNISYVTAILEVEANVYKNSFDEAVREKDEAINDIKKTYLSGTKTYSEKLAEADKEFARKVSQAQRIFAQAGTEAINRLREYEMQRVQTVDETKLNKLKSIKDIPMSESELLALVQKFDIKGDYWSSRLIQTIAYNNSITGIEVESSLDTKMSVLNQLEYQMNEIIKYYPANNDDVKRPMVRFGYLTENILENAKKIYGGKMRYESDETLTERAYLNIVSKYGDIEKGFAIQNSLKNAKGQVKNLLLCKLAKGNYRISDFAIELSGAKEDIDSFRNGKSREYMKARNAVDRALKATNRDTVLQILEDNADNEFMKPLLEDAKKRNKYFKGLIAIEEQSVEAERENKQ